MVRLMILVLIFLSLSLIGTVVAVMQPVYSDWLLLTGPVAIAAALILIRHLLWRGSHQESGELIIVDGSNVMYWQNNSPGWAPLHDLLHLLDEMGFSPALFFDANAGYLLSGHYQHDQRMAEKLGLSRQQVTVVPKGVQADGMILETARKHGASIITNDRYRDWADRFPELREEGWLVTGGYQAGELRLDLPLMSRLTSRPSPSHNVRRRWSAER